MSATRSEAFDAKWNERLEVFRTAKKLLPHHESELDQWCYSGHLHTGTLADLQREINEVRYSIVCQLARENPYIHEFLEDHFQFSKVIEGAEHLHSLFCAMPVLLQLQVLHEAPIPSRVM